MRKLYEKNNLYLYTDDEKDTVRSYTQSSYSDFNDYFRFGNSLNDITNRIHIMDKALEKKQFKQKTILYRGIGSISDLFSTKKRPHYIQPDIIENLDSLIGKKIIDKGFLSTTPDIKVAKYWSGRKEDQGGYLVLNVNKGVSYIDRQEMLNDNSGEKEIILERNLKIEITKIEYDIDNNNKLKIYVDVKK